MAESDDSVDVQDPDRMSNSNPKIIIIGAGISGIAAANQLALSGFSDFKILEATNRTGGRICSVPVGESSYTCRTKFLVGLSRGHSVQ